jgi:hypothetical protein
VRRLELLDSDADQAELEVSRVGPHNKAEVLLVAAGVKPAAVTYLKGPSYFYDEPPQPVDGSSTEYIDTLHGLGLLTTTSIRTDDDLLPDAAFPDRPRHLQEMTVYMARTQE